MSYTSVVAADNPFIWWRMNDAGGAAIVDTQGNVAGVEQSPADTLYQQAGIITEAGQFSQGASDTPLSYILGAFAAPQFFLCHPCSIEWWTTCVPLQAGQNGIQLLTTGVNQGLYAACKDGTGAMQVWFESDPFSDPADITTAAGFYETTGRHHYVMTYNGTLLQVFKDGVATNNTIIAIATSVIALVWNPLNNFGGNVDEIALYKSALSFPQVAAHYAAGVATTAAPNWIPPNAPPSAFPPAVAANDGLIGGTATPPNAPPLTPQAPIATQAIVTAPAAPPTPPRNYQDGYTTTTQINTLFKIVSPRPGSGS